MIHETDKSEAAQGQEIAPVAVPREQMKLSRYISELRSLFLKVGDVDVVTKPVYWRAAAAPSPMVSHMRMGAKGLFVLCDKETDKEIEELLSSGKAEVVIEV